MGDKEKVVTTFYFQTFVWYPSKKEKAEFPRKFTLQEIKQQLWQGAKMSCQAKLASLPLSEKYMFKIGWGTAYKPFLLWLLVKGSTLQMPAKCALRAPCPWEWHKKAKKVPKSEAGTQRHRWWKSAFSSKKKPKTSTREKQHLPPGLYWDREVIFQFSDVCRSVQIVSIFDTAEIRLLKFYQPSHSSSIKLILISPICYLKISLAKRPLLN